MSIDSVSNNACFVCARLKEARKACGLTQEDLGKIVGSATRTIMSWEKNIPVPSDKLALACKAGLDGLYVLTGVWQGASHSGAIVSQDIIKEILVAEQEVNPVMSKNDLNKSIRLKAILIKTYLDSLGKDEVVRAEILNATAMALAAAQG